MNLNNIHKYNSLVLLLIAGLLLFNCCEDSARKSFDEHSKGDKLACDSLLIMAEELSSSNISMAHIYLEKARTILDPQLCLEDLGRYHMVNGRIFYYEDKYTESICHFDSALQILDDIESPKYLAKTYAFYSATNYYMGNYAVAIESILKSISINMEIGDELRLADDYIFIGNIYLAQDDNNQAKAYLEQAHEITQLNSQGIQNATVLSTKGDIFKSTGELEKAESYLFKAYDIRVKCANMRHIAYSLCQLADLRYLQAKYEDAIGYLKEAEQIYHELSEKAGLFDVYIAFANIYTAQNKLQNALENADKAKEISVDINSVVPLAEATKSLYEIYEKSKDFKKAFEYFKEYHNNKTQLVSIEKNRLIANIEYNSELENKTKDNEILRQKNQTRKQQLILLSVFALVLVVLVFVLVVLARLRTQNFRNKQMLLEKKKEMAEAKSKLHEKEKIILENNLEIRNKELTSKTVELLHQIETLQTLAGRMKKLKDSASKSEVEEILHELKMKTRESVWDEFHSAFNNVHEEFYSNLLNRCPDLSSTEIKIAALLKLNLSTKEIAAISYKSDSAVKTARHRLRNKLHLTAGEDLITFLMKM